MPDRRTFLKNLGASSALAAFSTNFSLPKNFPSPNESPSASQLASDHLRPQFHLLPARNWMNDPNGPLYFQNRYHMFFQYNPSAAVWGDMHWAHAVSPDMLHWKHLPIALAPTPGGPDADGCFSGSAIIHEGTPTFLYTGVKTVAPSEATLRDGTHNFLETQCLATSRDPDLLNWRKHATPVLLPPSDPKLTGFRDPCLWQEKNLWYMGIGSGQRGLGGQVLLYRSADLLHWESLHALAHGSPTGLTTPDPVDAGDMWECPDFFPLDGKHVLLYSTQRKVFWEVGEYDPKEHLFHSQKRGLLDYGDFYAPKSQLDAQGRRILWGWIPETRPEAEFSAAGWAGCMSLPRALAVLKNGDLSIGVIAEAAELNAAQYEWNINVPGQPSQRAGLREFALSEACARLELWFAEKPFRLSLTDGTTSIVQISYDPSNAGRELQINSKTLPLPHRRAGDHRVWLFLDASVIECFDDDTLALTTRVYRAPQSKLRLSISDADLSALYSLSLSPIKPISPDRLTT